MVGPKTLIQRCLRAYPDRFRNGNEVLKYVLFTLHNGWSWKNGTLVTSDPLTPWRPETMEKSYGMVTGSSQLLERFNTALYPSLVQRNKNNQSIVDTIDERTTIIPLEGEIFVHENSLFAQVPDDVSMAWRKTLEFFTSNVKLSTLDMA